ncbi:MAG: hypothetical protein ACYTAF_12970 [Planctomycetota bacterium]
MKSHRLLAALCAVLLAACTAPRPPAGPDHPTIFWEPLQEGPFTEGELLDVRIEITNETGRYVLLREMLPTDASPPISWQETARGRSYRRETEKGETTERIFNNGLLCPLEAIEFHIRLRLVGGPKGFRLRYQVYDLAGLPRDIYFGTGDKDGVYEFRPLYGMNLEAKLVPIRMMGQRTHRTVLFPYWQSREPKEEVLVIDAPCERRAFTLEEAGRKIGVTSGNVRWTYCTAFDGWVIQQKPEGAKEKAWIVRPEGAVEIAPAVNPGTLYHLIDSWPARNKLEVEVRARRRYLEEHYMTVEDESRGKRRWVTFIERGKWPAFFRKVNEYGAALDADAGRVLVVERKD